MTDATIDPAILDLVGSGETVLFIGAGFSLIPTDSDRKSRVRKGLRDVLIANYRATLKDAPYDLDSMSMEDIVFYLRVQGITKREIAKTIRGFLASSEELVKLQSFTLLRSLLTLLPGLFEAIITTNWDRGIEESLRGISSVVINPLVTDKDCLKYDPSQLSVLKIHGDIEDPDSIILSSQDFDVYEKEHPRILERLRILLSTKYVILLGYAARDENFRRIYRSLHYDLGTELRGGCIVSPSLGDREKLWTPAVNLKHVRALAQDFLSEVLSHIARIPLGTSSASGFRESRNSIRFEPEAELNKLARRVKQKYALREVWVARLREMDRPNRAIGQVAAFYLESRCRSARSLAISTGETMDTVAATLDTTVFRHRMTVFPTIVILAGPREFKDPSYVAQTLGSRFELGKAVCLSLRLPDEDYLSYLIPKRREKDLSSLAMAVRTIGIAQVTKAVESDVIISSLRPCHWFGGKDLPGQRTIPIQWVLGISPEKLNAALREASVAAITQMILLDESGKDVASLAGRQSVLYQLNRLICRPSVKQLKRAAESKRRVITVASHVEKLASVRALLRARLCNTLVLDETLADGLLE